MIKYSKAVLYNTDLDTTQAFVFSESNHYLAILTSGSGDDVFTKIRQVVMDLEEDFFSMEDDLPERFEKLYQTMQAKLAGLEAMEVLLASWRVADTGTESVKGTTDILYLQSWGEGKVYLKRQEEIIPLITQSQSGQLISGYLQQGDRILLLSKTLDKILSSDSGRLGYTLSLPVTDLEDELQSFLPEQGVMNPLAAILIDYRLEEEPQPLLELPSQANHAPIEIPDYNLSAESRTHESKRKLAQVLSKLPKIPNPISTLRLKRQTPSQDNPSRFAYHEPTSPQYLSSSINSKAWPFRTIHWLVSNKKRLAITLGGAAIILVVLIIVFHSHHTNQVKSALFQSLMTSAKNDFTTADSLKDLNTDSAKQSLNRAESEINQALQLNPKDGSALDLKKQIDAGKDDILKIYHISDWPQFLDLKLIKSNFSAEQMSYAGGKFLLLDPIQKTLVSVDASQKTNQILGGSLQFGDAQAASLNDALAAVYSTDKGVLTLDITNPIKPAVAIKSDSAWGKITGLDSFSGNIYLLDSGKNTIWKYVATTNGYTDKTAYLQDGVKANFSDAKKILIDSSIWVLKASGEIDKFSSGATDFFSPANLDTPLKDVTSFYISPDTTNIYLLDTGNGRLVVLQKNGQYISQYVGDKFKDATDVAVDEKAKKIYLLENNSIYMIDLH